MKISALNFITHRIFCELANNRATKPPSSTPFSTFLLGIFFLLYKMLCIAIRYELNDCTFFFFCYHSIIFHSPAIHLIFFIQNAFHIIFFCLRKLFLSYILCRFNLMRYASSFILHLKAFFSRSFLSISMLHIVSTRIQFLLGALDTMRSRIRCDSMYFQFFVLSLEHFAHTHIHKMKRLNGEKKITLFFILWLSFFVQCMGCA